MELITVKKNNKLLKLLNFHWLLNRLIKLNNLRRK